MELSLRGILRENQLDRGRELGWTRHLVVPLLGQPNELE